MDPGKVKSLVNFVNSIGVGDVIESLHQLKDGKHFMSMIKILTDNDVPDCDNPMQCYRFILEYLEGFYQSSLKYQLDFSQIVHGSSISEVAKVTTLLLCSAIQSEKVKIFVDAITELDLMNQNDLKEIIQFIVEQESSHKLRADFADILHRRGDHHSSEPSRHVLQPMEISSPIPRAISTSSAFSNSPMSPVHNLINSPYMVSKLNNRRLHDRVRSLESKVASETALRQDLEAEIIERNNVIGTKEKQIRELQLKVTENNKLKDQIDELHSIKADLQKSTRENDRLKKLLEKKAELKTDNAHLEKQNEELLSERQELKYMMKGHSAIKNQFEETRVQLRRSELNLGELHRDNLRLTAEVESALKERQELTHMMETSQQMYKEKIALLEEQLMQASAPVLGESLGIITEQRVSELELELEKVHMTWTNPEMHQKMKTLYEETCQAAQTYEAKLKENEARMRELEEEVNSLRSTWVSPDDHQKLKNMYEKEVTSLRSTWASPDDHQKLKNMYEEERETKEAYETKLKETEGENSHSVHRITEMELELNKVTRMRDEALQQKQEVETQLQHSMALSADLQEQIAHLREDSAKERQELEKQLQHLMTESEDLHQQILVLKQDAEKEKGGWCVSEENLKQEKLVIETHLQHSNALNGDLQQQISHLQREAEKEKQDWRTLTESLKQEKGDVEGRLKAALSEVADLQNCLAQLKQRHDTDCETWKDSEEKLKLDVRAVDVKLQETLTQVEELKTKNDTLSKDLQERNGKVLDIEAKMKQNGEDKESQFHQARILMEKLQSQNGSLTVELENKEQCLHATKTELQAVITESNSLLQKADDRIKDLESKSRRMEQDLESGSEVLRVAEEKIKEDNTENELKLQAVSTKVIDLQKQNQQLKQDLDRKLEDWLVKEEKMRQEKEAMENHLGQATVKIEMMEQKYSSLKEDLGKENADLCLRQKNMEEQKREVEARLEKMNQEKQAMENHLGQATVKIEMLEQKYSSLKEDLGKEDADLCLRLKNMEEQKREVETRLEKADAQLEDLQHSNWLLKQNLENKDENLKLTEEKMKREGESQLLKSQKQMEELQHQNGRLKQDVDNMHDILLTTAENKKLWEEKIKLLEEKVAKDEAESARRQHHVVELEKEIEHLTARLNEASQKQQVQEIAFTEQIERLRGETPNQTLPSSVQNSITDITPPSHPRLNLTHDVMVNQSVDSLDGLAVSRFSQDDTDLRMDDLETDHDLRAGSVASLRSTGSNRSTRSTRSRTRIEITMSGKRSESRSTSRTESHFGSQSQLGSQFGDFSHLGGSLNSLGADFPDNVARTLDELEASNVQLSASNRRDTLDTHRTTGPSGFFLVGCGEEEPVHIDWEDRLEELQRRNTLCRPHLQTSYPVETQTRAPKEITETDLKIGVETRRSSLRLSRGDDESMRMSTRKRKSDKFKFEEPASKQMRSASSCQAMPPPPAPSTKTGMMTRKAVSHSSMPAVQQTHFSSTTSSTSKDKGHIHNAQSSKCNSRTSLSSAARRSSPRLGGSRSSLAASKTSLTSLTSQSSRASLASTASRAMTQSSRPSSRTSMGSQSSRTSLAVQAMESSGKARRRSTRSNLGGSTNGFASSSSTLKNAKNNDPVLPEIEESLNPRRESVAYSVGFSPRKISRRRRSMRFSISKKPSLRGSPGLSQVKQKESTPQKKTPSKKKSMARFFGK